MMTANAMAPYAGRLQAVLEALEGMNVISADVDGSKNAEISLLLHSAEDLYELARSLGEEVTTRVEDYKPGYIVTFYELEQAGVVYRANDITPAPEDKP